MVVADASIGFDVIDVDGSLSGSSSSSGSITTDPSASSTATSVPSVSSDPSSVDAGNSTIAARQSAVQSLTGIQSLAAANTVAAGASTANAIDNQTAVCWTAFSKKTGGFYLSDIGTNIISEISVDGATLAATLVNQYPLGTGIATLDEDVATVGGTDYLYVLAANSTSIEVVALPSLGHGQHIQSFVLQATMQSMGLSFKADNLQGMTTFVRQGA